MKKQLVASLMVVAGSVSASELDVQEGQWSVEMNPTELSLFFRDTGYEQPDSEYSNRSESTEFNIQGAGTYGLNDKTQIGAFARVFANTDTDRETQGGSDTVRDTEKDSGYQLNPFISRQITDGLWLRGEASYYYSGANVETDIDGNKSYTSDNYNSTEVWLGVEYKKDLRDNLLMTASALIGSDWIKYVDEEDSSDTLEQNYRRLNLRTTGRYFFNDSFSVNVGLALYTGQLHSEADDGEDVDLSNYKWSYFNYGTTFGFTYYHR